MREFETARLRLRAFRLDDLDAVADLYARPEVMRFLGREPKVADRDAARERLERYLALQHPVQGVWAIEHLPGEPLLGAVLLKDIPRSGATNRPSGEVEIGWHLHPDAWGHGYATEAAREVLTHAFDAGLRRVVAVTYPQNEASQRVALRLGMRHAGPTDAYYDMTVELFIADSGGV